MWVLKDFKQLCFVVWNVKYDNNKNNSDNKKSHLLSTYSEPILSRLAFIRVHTCSISPILWIRRRRIGKVIYLSKDCTVAKLQSWDQDTDLFESHYSLFSHYKHVHIDTHSLITKDNTSFLSIWTLVKAARLHKHHFSHWTALRFLWVAGLLTQFPHGAPWQRDRPLSHLCNFMVSDTAWTRLTKFMGLNPNSAAY